MDRKILILAIISCVNADQPSIELLPPLNVPNVFHESGITFVSPTSRNLGILSSVQTLPLPITHAFGFLSHNPNRPQEPVRTHSIQSVTNGLHSPVTAQRSPNGINVNIKRKITSHKHGDGRPFNIKNDGHVNTQSPSTDVVQARFVENDFHGVHEINSPTQHFEYKVRTVPQTIERHEHIPQHNNDVQFTKQAEFNQRRPVAKHSIYGVPTQDEIDMLPVFQNDKFLSPVIRHTNTPTTHSSNEPLAQTINDIFDPTFNSKKPTIHSKKPATTTQHTFNGDNQQYRNRFVLSDGTTVLEEGKLISPVPGWENIIAKTGEYSYISPEGIPVKVKWIADHEGFRIIN